MTLDKRTLKKLRDGDIETVSSLLAGVDASAVAECFADLLDGLANPNPLLGGFIYACWDGRTHAADRRAKGRKIPVSIRDVPTSPQDRRSYILASFDAVPAAIVPRLLAWGFSVASPESLYRAAKRARAAGPTPKPTPEHVLPNERAAISDAARKLGATSPTDTIRALTRLQAAAEQAISDAIAGARSAGLTWREIGDGLGLTPEAARKRSFRRR